MATISKKTIKGKPYYYFEHTVKEDGVYKKKSIYFGKEIPKDMKKIKQEFFHKLFREKYNKNLNSIKENFTKERREFPKSALEKDLDYFMIKFTYNSNRIEGSTLTLKETAKLLEQGITPKDKPLNDVKESEAHKKVFYDMMEYEGELNLSTVLYWHRILLKETKSDIAGVIRRHLVKVAGSKTQFPVPTEVDFLLREFFIWYVKNKGKLHPVECAALVHLKFVSIHPFSDGNGRISRLIMNFILKKNNFPMLNIKYTNRSAYYTALERAQVKGKEWIFVEHLIKKYLKEYKKYW